VKLKIQQLRAEAFKWCNATVLHITANSYPPIETGKNYQVTSTVGREGMFSQCWMIKLNTDKVTNN